MGDLVRTTLRWTVANGLAEARNVLFVQNDAVGATSDGNVARIGDLVMDWWEAGANSFFPPDVAIQPVELQRVTIGVEPTPPPNFRAVPFGSPLLGRPAAAAPGPNGNGTGVLPPQVTLVISLRTATAGRRARGRLYVAQPESDGITLASGLLSTAKRDAWDSIWADLVFTRWPAGVAEQRNRLTVFSRMDGVVREVTNLRVGRRVDTQRRRLNQIPEPPYSL